MASKERLILVSARTKEEIIFLLRNHGYHGNMRIKAFTEGAGMNHFHLSKYLHIYRVDSRTVVINTIFEHSDGHHVPLLEAVGELIQASNSDFKTLVLKDHPRFGVTAHGLWAIPEKNYDYYRFDLRHPNGFRIIGREVTDIYLIGEGNNLRTVRRHIRRLLETTRDFSSEDIARIRAKQIGYYLNIVIRFANGRVLDFNKGEVIDSKSTRRMPASINSIVQGRVEFSHDVPMVIPPHRDPFVEVLVRGIDE